MAKGGVQQVGHASERLDSVVLQWAILSLAFSIKTGKSGVQSLSIESQQLRQDLKKVGNMTSLPVCCGTSEFPKMQRVASLMLCWLLVSALFLG